MSPLSLFCALALFPRTLRKSRTVSSTSSIITHRHRVFVAFEPTTGLERTEGTERNLHCDARCPASPDARPSIRRVCRSDRRLPRLISQRDRRSPRSQRRIAIHSSPIHQEVRCPIATFVEEDRCSLAIRSPRGLPRSSPSGRCALRRRTSVAVAHSLARRPLLSLARLIEGIARRPTPRNRKARHEQNAAQKSAEDLAIFSSQQDAP